MRRDIENYTQKYLEKDFSDFESYMVAFRRNKVLVIKPSSMFVENAQKDFKEDSRQYR